MKKSLIIIIAVAVVGILIYNSRSSSAPSAKGVFSTDITGLVEAKTSETIELENGDSYNLTASIVKKKIGGNEIKMLAYNGMIPGPMIKVPQGAEVTLNFTNNTDVDTTIHSHGVRLENQFDGVPNVTQKAVKPGGSFTYKVTFPDEGMYWYHPHIREDYAQELGLYGNYLVVSNDPNYWSLVNREVALFVDDILIENGRIALFSKTFVDHTLMGRFGNIMLVNGETDYSLQAKTGEVVRFYITNVANTRTFNFTISGVKMKLVGGDGGSTEREEWKDAVIIGPSERSVVEVLFDTEGSYTLQNKTPDKTYTLGTVSVSGGGVSPSYAKTFATLRTNTIAVKSIDPYRQYFDKPIDKRLALEIDMIGGMMSSAGGHMMSDGTMMGGTGMMGGVPEGGIEWDDDMRAMNEMSTKEMTDWKIVDQGTGKANMDIDWQFKVGDVVKIRITNDAKSDHPMQHPIHFHGQQFLVLDRNGVEETNLLWKDTVLVPAGQYVDMLLNVTNPGEWMAHCHIAEHLEADMMMKFTVKS